MKFSADTLKKLLLHFFFPRTCVSCGKDLPWNEDGFLCTSCTALLKRPGPHICLRCGVNLPSGGAHCYACRGSKANRYACRLIRSAWEFNTVSRAVVHGLKYHFADYTADFMGRQLAQRFVQLPELAAAELIIPVPLFAKRLRKRGYNQSELLARSLAYHTGLAWTSGALVRTRDTQSQTHLGRKARQANMTGAFACVQPQRVRGKIILLVDDVATTGATLEGCAAALRAAGARYVFALTYAREN